PGAADGARPQGPAGAHRPPGAAHGHPGRRPGAGPPRRTGLAGGRQARRRRAVARRRVRPRRHRRPGGGAGLRPRPAAGAPARRRPHRGGARRAAHREPAGRGRGRPRRAPATDQGGDPVRAPTARAPVGLSSTTPDGVGASPRRPDGTLKVTGEFAYSSDMWMEDMLWGATLRSPHPHARILGIDTTGAVKLPGVHAVLTHEDVPGEKRDGLEYRDQPVLAFGEVRYKGEPVAIVAADHPETARRALERIRVDYEVLDPVSDSRAAAFDPDCPLVHEEGSLPLHEEYNQRGNVVRHQPIRTGAFASGAS